jgi:hypothetical protein
MLKILGRNVSLEQIRNTEISVGGTFVLRNITLLHSAPDCHKEGYEFIWGLHVPPAGNPAITIVIQGSRTMKESLCCGSPCINLL